MLGDIDAIANVAVRDMDVARRFYEGKLGLTPADAQCEGVIGYRSGNTKLYVYRSDFAGTNQATAVTWEVGDRIDELVRALAAHGVVFEHYEMPDMTLEGDVHVAGKMRVAWFRDPDGNILSLANG
ncbi:MAG TPA: VOC family protein [Lysobacter sp.]|nr:VOC family protein [Lysobacter sp.]